MKNFVLGILVGIGIFIGIQMILPFPYGLVFGIITLVGIIWYSKKHDSLGRYSVLKYKRIDPIDSKEKAQNEDALRILEKKYLEEKISKEEYLKRKKEFSDLEYHPRKCLVCGSEEFDFISKNGNKKLNRGAQEDGCYICKKCGHEEN